MNTGLRGDVAAHFRQHPGTVIELPALTAAVGYVDEEDGPAKVRAAVAYVIRSGNLPGLEVVSRASSWVYTPPANRSAAAAKRALKVGTTFELIGFDPKTNGPIVRHQSGTLHRVSDL